MLAACDTGFGTLPGSALGKSEVDVALSLGEVGGSASAIGEESEVSNLKITIVGTSDRGSAWAAPQSLTRRGKCSL